MEEKDKKSIIDEIRMELDDLEVQLKKSGKEFKETYAEKKTKIAGLIKNYASKIEGVGEEKMHDLKNSTDELLDLLEADYNISYTDYEANSHKISSAIDRFESKTKEMLDNLNSEAKQAGQKLNEELSKNLDKFRMELDIQMAHFKGTKDRAANEFETWKEKRLNDIEKLKTDLEGKKEETEDKLEKFSDEIATSYSHLRQAFKNLW